MDEKMKMEMLLWVLGDLLHLTHLVLMHKWRKSEEMSVFVYGEGEKMKNESVYVYGERKGWKYDRN